MHGHLNVKFTYLLLLRLARNPQYTSLPLHGEAASLEYLEVTTSLRNITCPLNWNNFQVFPWAVASLELGGTQTSIFNNPLGDVTSPFIFTRRWKWFVSSRQCQCPQENLACTVRRGCQSLPKFIWVFTFPEPCIVIHNFTVHLTRRLVADTIRMISLPFV